MFAPSLPLLAAVAGISSQLLLPKEMFRVALQTAEQRKYRGLKKQGMAPDTQKRGGGQGRDVVPWTLRRVSVVQGLKRKAVILHIITAAAFVHSFGGKKRKKEKERKKESPLGKSSPGCCFWQAVSRRFPGSRGGECPGKADGRGGRTLRALPTAEPPRRPALSLPHRTAPGRTSRTSRRTRHG